MSLTVAELRAHAAEAVAHRAGWSSATRRWTVDDDRPPPKVPAAEVVPHLESDDRNIRVAALRVLAFSDGSDAAAGILRGLDDPVKRVREVAAKSSARFVGDERVVARLVQAIENDEPGSSGSALQVLGGIYGSPHGLNQVEPVARAMATLAHLPRHRQAVLIALLRARTLDEGTSAVLRDFVANGTKDEAVAATRRLCGYRVERREVLTEDVRQTAERAWGELWYWVGADSDG